MTNPQKIIVIGAGICGVSTAIWLRRAGHEVLLLDKTGPGAGASFGNAGLLAQWAIVPVNRPGIMQTGLKYMFSPKSPLFMQWSYFPKLFPWLIKYISRANDADTRRTVEALIPLLSDSVEQHIALTRGTRAEKWIAQSDLSFAYDTRAKFDADSYGWDLRREAGFEVELIEGRAVQEAEPILNGNITCLAVMKNHGHILNPGDYLIDLVQVLRDEGGQYRQAEVRNITLTDGRITSVETDHGSLPCDRAVLTAGIWSKPLMRKLGVKVMLEAERGYHLHYKNASLLPNNPLMMASGKFAVNPMGANLRCAGIVELGGIEKPPSQAPFRLLRGQVAKYFNDFTYDSVEEWMGFRPSTPDSLPLIGEIGQTHVMAGFGHQHIGLTAGPKTGRILADLISGQRSNIDLSAYDANRF
ncbi:D-amino acid dehydrogenase [hydrothermal vent metagenome]|uniref:D-amino acid dehydrogenase n=1 Tax=hydrothermal vent metagenome TaxID=652676 RepID=A0A3B0SBH9_9ZZZZ